MWYNGAGGDFLTHLLVVDDEVSILELIKNSLGKDGWEGNSSLFFCLFLHFRDAADSPLA